MLAPFQYFGINDGTDLSQVNWRSGRYDVSELTNVYTADHMRVKRVIQEVEAKVTDPLRMRALGFCVSIKHAEFMAAQFNEAGIAARCVFGKTAKGDRAEAVAALERGDVQVLFTVDLFNEGVDLPDVDTVLFLRPTESATIFLQQLGRGLRRAEGKECLTVLDFIGGAHRKFRFDLKYRALLGGTRRQIKRAVEEGFPSLPAGCALKLDRHAADAVLKNIKHALQLGYRALVEDLQGIGRDVSLSEFLREAEVDLEDVYARAGHTWTRLRREAGLPAADAGPDEKRLGRAMARLIHVTDPERLEVWREWLAADEPPAVGEPGTRTRRLQLMLYTMLGNRGRAVSELGDGLRELWDHPALRAELAELLGVLEDRSRTPTYRYDARDIPLQVHASYALDEVMSAFGVIKSGAVFRLREGIYFDEPSKSQLAFVTLTKSEEDYSPSTLYNDYAMTPELFHWESQSGDKEQSKAGQRYIHHEKMGIRFLLFVRDRRKDDRGLTSPYVFLGPASYVSHEGERPMEIVWRLERPMPAGFYQDVKVAAG